MVLGSIYLGPYSRLPVTSFGTPFSGIYILLLSRRNTALCSKQAAEPYVVRIFCETQPSGSSKV